MILTYNNFGLQELGEITVSQSRQPDPPEAPQRMLVTMRVRLDVFQGSFADNFGRLKQLNDALKTQHATLVWRDSTTATPWLNQVATLTASDLPEDPNAWGTYHAAVNLVFSFIETDLITNAQVAKFRKNAAGAFLTLGHVTRFSQQLQERRFSEFRNQREKASGQMELSGLFQAVATDSLSTRRTKLLAQKSALLALSGGFGQLQFADVDQNVRLDTIKAEVDQAVQEIRWTLTASYTVFPLEGGYATVEMDIDERESTEEAEKLLTFSGRVQATDKTIAETKLAAMRTAVLKQYGYSAAQMLNSDKRDKVVSANADDAKPSAPDHLFAPYHATTNASPAWIELTFSETYRKRKANVLNWSLRVSPRDDVRSGLKLTTYSGTVTATGASVDLAKTAADGKANELGRDKVSEAAGLFLGSSFTWETRQINQTVFGGAALAGSGAPPEFMRLEFSFEYQEKSALGLHYLEWNSEATTEVFGTDGTNVSGSVVAATYEKAMAAYTRWVRSPYTYKLVRGERFTRSLQRTARGDDAATSALEQFIRLEFSFSVFEDKPAGAIGLRYSVTVARDFEELIRTIDVQGSVFGPASTLTAMQMKGSSLNENPLATNFLDMFFSGVLGLRDPDSPATALKPKKDSRSLDHEYQPNAWSVGLTPTAKKDAVLKLDFSASYEMPLKGESGILSCEVSEEIEFSSTRWVAQPLPDGVSIMQNCGTEPGRRTVRGSVKAATLEACELWAKRKRKLLTGWTDPATEAAQMNELPGRLDCHFDFASRLDGMARTEGPYGSEMDVDGTPNVRVHRVDFSWGEVLGYYPLG